MSWRRFSLVVRAMLREEWRLHSDLFGDGRFATFPLTLFSLSFVAAFGLALVGVSLDLLAAGAVALAFMLGLQTGSVGFEGRDALDDLLGGGTLLLFSTRTLPLAKRTAVAAFVVKDVVYYAVLFILPITLGVVAGHGGALAAAPNVAGTAGPVLAPWLTVNAWLAGIFAFCLGISLMLALTGVIARGLQTITLLAFVGGVLVAVGLDRSVAAGLASLGPSTPPYDAVQFGAAALLTVLVTAAGVVRFDPDAGRRSRERSRNAYALVADRLGHSRRDALVAKALVDVQRSSGGVWKLLVSSTILIAAAYVVLEVIQAWLAFTMAPGIVFGTLLGATAFSTYNWLMHADDPQDYHHYPVAARDLFVAKGIAFALLQLPIVALYYLLVWAVVSPTAVDLAVGSVLLVGLTTYLFGATVYFTGFRPDEFLFDTVVFSRYCLVSVLGLLPALLAGFVLASSIPFETAAGLVLYGVVACAAGVGMFTRAIPRWASELAA